MSTTQTELARLLRAENQSLLMTIARGAELSGLSAKLLERAARDGRLKAVRHPTASGRGGRWMLTAEALAEFLSAGGRS